MAEALGHLRVSETPNFKIRPCAQNENEFYLHGNEKSFGAAVAVRLVSAFQIHRARPVQ